MAGRVAIVVVGLSACGFTSQPALVDGTPVVVDGTVDAAPPITCGELMCDPNAICATVGPAACACKPGFTGDGRTCSDVDECATANAGCSAACMNTPGSFVCYAPSTCADVKAHVAGAADGPYTLYLGGDPGKPWTAHCAQMATTPVEYLSLTGVNTSQYTQGGASPGSDVRTTYSKVRFDPATLKVDIRDRVFATSQGTLDHSGDGVPVTSMPYAVAMDCRADDSRTGRASIDLRATQFALTGAEEFAAGGKMPGSMIDLTDGNQRATIAGGGFCGWVAPVGTPSNPFNDTVTAGLLLPLSYHP
jgi:GON domain/Complement Clr-like EGF-like